jgi:hypothetical protein
MGFEARRRMLAHQIGGPCRSGVLMSLENEPAHAAGFGEGDGVENIKRPDDSASPRCVRIEMHMDVDRAHQRRIVEAEIDRPTHRVDLPILKLGGSGQCLTGVLTPARAVGTQNDA